MYSLDTKPPKMHTAPYAPISAAVNKDRSKSCSWPGMTRITLATIVPDTAEKTGTSRWWREDLCRPSPWPNSRAPQKRPLKVSGKCPMGTSNGEASPERRRLAAGPWDGNTDQGVALTPSSSAARFLPAAAPGSHHPAELLHSRKEAGSGAPSSEHLCGSSGCAGGGQRGTGEAVTAPTTDSTPSGVKRSI